MYFFLVFWRISCRKNNKLVTGRDWYRWCQRDWSKKIRNTRAQWWFRSDIIHIEIFRRTVSRALSEWRSPILSALIFSERRARKGYLFDVSAYKVVSSVARATRSPRTREAYGNIYRRDDTARETRHTRATFATKYRRWSHRCTRATHTYTYVRCRGAREVGKESSGDIRGSTTRADDSEAHAAPCDLLLRSSSRRRRSARFGWG